MADTTPASEINATQDFWPADPNYTYGDVLPFRRANVAGSPVELAVPNLVRGVVNDLALSATAPGNALAGRLPSEQLPEIASRMGMALLGLGMGTNALMGGGEASLGMFAGRGAQGADTGALARAMHLDSKGFAPEDIHADTGWFKGPDEQWRFEIPDSEASWIGPRGRDDEGNQYAHAIPVVPRELTLGDVLHHPQLFDQYPELRSVTVSPEYEPGVQASQRPGQIGIGLGSPADVLSATLHETQHEIQDREGFAQGGNPSQFLPPEFKQEYQNQVDDLASLRQVTKTLGANYVSVEKGLQLIKRGIEPPHYVTGEIAKVMAHDPDMVQQYSETLHNVLDKTKQSQSAFEKYQSLAGEVEARNVQERHAQGATGFPLATQGYPTGPQIIQFRGQSAALHPVEHDPWEGQLVPVEHDPFEEEPAK